MMENLPNEIVLQILGYLSLGELIQCARVSNRLKNICKDRSLRYKSSMSVIKILTVKDQKSIIDILIARPEVTEVTMKNPSNSLETKNFSYGCSGFGLKKKKILVGLMAFKVTRTKQIKKK